jgi:ATP-dependent HslUV protease, peptidase subunit HslV
MFSLENGGKFTSGARFRSTTILSVRKDGCTVMAGDGQVTLEDTIMKHRAAKVRLMYKDQVLVGFAGASADAFSLLERLEGKLEAFNGNLTRAAVELAKALLLTSDCEHTFIVSGNGDVIEPDLPVAAIGSGGPYALAAARALVDYSELSAAEVAREAMKIAASICIYTNEHINIQELTAP